MTTRSKSVLKPGLLAGCALALLASAALAQSWGPYNADFPAGGDGLSRPLAGAGEGQTLPAGAPWSLS
ncbi:hypothetical protein DMC18_21035, partial [Caulobacter sp. D5]|uniref:hypothetical protein n=1 Tax=Caulobacter sp. D5 TaxID=357400 RepID=UPI000D9217BE